MSLSGPAGPQPPPRTENMRDFVRRALRSLCAIPCDRSKPFLLSPEKLADYQIDAIAHILQNPYASCWLDVGLGKTVVTLSAFAILQDYGRVMTGFAVAPLRVAQSVWKQEAVKWEHLRHLKIELVLGSREERQYALSRDADLWVINPENLDWLLNYARRNWRLLPWQMVIADEVTLFKTTTNQRSRALIALSATVDRRVGLTGEPAANGYVDLFGQYRFMDGGKRLGQHVTDYRNAYLKQKPNGFGWYCPRESQARIRERIQDITLEQSALRCLDLPPVRRQRVWVDLPPAAQRLYDAMERSAFVTLPSGQSAEAINAAGILNKLVQLASGATYLGQSSAAWEEVHTAKTDVIADLLEESGGRPVLLGHTYVHERDRLLAKFPEAVALDSTVSAARFAEMVENWKADRIPLLCLHPKSAGHGLNLQGGSARMVIWLSLPWSLELRNQLEGRLFGGHRREGAGVIVEVLARRTVDELILHALSFKDGVQVGLKAAIYEYRDRKGL